MSSNRLAFATLLLVFLVGCPGGNDDNPPKQHIWQDQVNALEKAKGVEQIILDSANRRRQEIDENTR